jgi:hypothetical protein
LTALGFGHVLTGFTIAPLSLPEDEQQKVINLGTLCNFIVATYDHLLDQGIAQNRLLARWKIQLMFATAKQPWTAALRLMGPPESSMFIGLVSSYIHGLYSLAYTEKHKSILTYIPKSIIRVYDAEIETLRVSSLKSCTLQRKAALPFVIMGLPAWLGRTEVCPELFWWHMRWLYRLGEFFGWIDDLVDLAEDKKAHRPNWFIHTYPGFEARGRTDAELVRIILERGKWIIDEWNHRVVNKIA